MWRSFVHVTSVRCDMPVCTWRQWDVTCLCTRDVSEIWRSTVHVTAVRCDMHVCTWRQWDMTCLCTREVSEMWHSIVHVKSVRCDMPGFMTCFEKALKNSNFRLCPSADILTPPKTTKYLCFLDFSANIVSYIYIYVCVCVCGCVCVCVCHYLSV
jgi:hypothetical protein